LAAQCTCDGPAVARLWLDSPGGLSALRFLHQADHALPDRDALALGAPTMAGDMEPLPALKQYASPRADRLRARGADGIGRRTAVPLFDVLGNAGFRRGRRDGPMCRPHCRQTRRTGGAGNRSRSGPGRPCSRCPPDKGISRRSQPCVSVAIGRFLASGSLPGSSHRPDCEARSPHRRHARNTVDGPRSRAFGAQARWA
jgi:hypothetical protein